MTHSSSELNRLDLHLPMVEPTLADTVSWMRLVLILAYAARPFKDRAALGQVQNRFTICVASNFTAHSRTRQRTMKFDIEIPTCREGVFVPNGFGGPADIVKTVEEAERLGFNAVWATDFLTPTPDYRIPDAAPPNWYEPM